jgi:hypothetical protein
LSDPWYGDIFIYLKTFKFLPNYLRDKWWWIHHMAKNYIIIIETLYWWGVELIL